MSTQDVDIVVNEFIEPGNNVFIALVWPSKGGDEKLMKMIQILFIERMFA